WLRRRGTHPSPTRGTSRCCGRAGEDARRWGYGEGPDAHQPVIPKGRFPVGDRLMPPAPNVWGSLFLSSLKN
ncbi:unnamed protein product, partial [Urochloa humidicola]